MNKAFQFHGVRTARAERRALHKSPIGGSPPRLPARSEWGERREDIPTNKSASSPQPSAPSCVRRRGRKRPEISLLSTCVNTNDQRPRVLPAAIGSPVSLAAERFP